MSKEICDTLCLHCTNACNRGCSWSDDQTPVDGWEAEYHILCGGIESYKVLACPQFVQETEENKNRNLDTDGCLKLVERVLEVARDDYIKGEEKGQHMIRKFIRGRGARRLTMIDDPEAVIRRLDRDTAIYRKKRAQKLIVR